jgi:hypothetical protein
MTASLANLRRPTPASCCPPGAPHLSEMPKSRGVRQPERTWA